MWTFKNNRPARLEDLKAKPGKAEVVACFELLLGRKPSSDEVHRALRCCDDLHSLVAQVLDSGHVGARTNNLGRLPFLLSHYGQTHDTNEDEWCDALGVRTLCSERDVFQGLKGQSRAHLIAEPLEWFALLSAVHDSQDSFTIAEVGAGYGPWASRGAKAWRKHHPTEPLAVIAVEGEPQHFAALQQHLARNNLAIDQLRLVEGAAAAHDGEVIFETAVDPARTWGTRALEGALPAWLPRVVGAGQITRPAWTLRRLFEGVPQVDFLHIDIQGSEREVLQAAGALLSEKVRHLLVGTHGRGLEEELLKLLPALGFRLLVEEPCRYHLRARQPVLVLDGAQYWVNLALVSPPFSTSPA